jgi:hypothetical protein
MRLRVDTLMVKVSWQDNDDLHEVLIENTPLIGW